ncbi:hypothetical protein [Candidatus Synchoanobacter obligatus]|uniref:DUF4214 domain-containing protein n=1 Tax=Candidatus Synchoanobacter obligatus TaxID=2919597 RepID=A0ABT1L4D4_9GAMM|nr:hypothetical protein [Candidatus Synchoanobacter obligatus]MCP8352022.1 hypothetical protein [Candidatus Synchoanobacter obligatus]
MKKGISKESLFDARTSLENSFIDRSSALKVINLKAYPVFIDNSFDSPQLYQSLGHFYFSGAKSDAVGLYKYMQCVEGVASINISHLNSDMHAGYEADEGIKLLHETRNIIKDNDDSVWISFVKAEQ